MHVIDFSGEEKLVGKAKMMLEAVQVQSREKRQDGRKKVNMEPQKKIKVEKIETRRNRKQREEREGREQR